LKNRLPFALILLASACAAPQQGEAPGTASTAAAAAGMPASLDPLAEDRRLMAFLDRVFDEAAARSPQTLTGLGIKQRYGELDDYTDANRARNREFSEAQLRRLKAEFDFAKLSPAGQLSYRLFENNVETGRRQFEWRWHQFLFSTNGSPAGSLPVFLINQHRVDTLADAEAYISRLRDVERAMNEVSGLIREQARMGIVPPKFVFEPVKADARKVLAGAPFAAGADSSLLADFKKKVGALQTTPETKAKLIADASAALNGPFRRGYDTFLAAVNEVEPKATSNAGAWRLPRGSDYYANQLRFFTTTDMTSDQIHQLGLTEVKRIQGEMEQIKKRVGFKGSLQQFFAHIKNGQQFKYPNTQAGREQYLKDANAFIAQAMAKAPEYFHVLPKAPLEVRAVEKFREATASVAFYNAPTPGRLAARHLLRQPRRHEPGAEAADREHQLS
jgi:uncharacterized protein (DUF885 family)